MRRRACARLTRDETNSGSVKKKVPVKPIEKLAPLVSGNITEAVPELGSGLGL